jgi:2-polyprenyl-3-methyl-5-hydroxy-6-metoxy-1,4-benzoquinol methylase
MQTAERSRNEERWRQEAEFFDRRAAETRIDLRLDPATVRRYSRTVYRKRFSPEFRVGLTRPLRGRAVLDVGCGDGVNSVLLAQLGARVTGVDVSGESLRLARQRVERNGLADHVTFIQTPIENADLPENGFDVVWGDGVLHHVLDELPLVMQRLVRWAHPDGLLVFSEPVNRCEALRRLRRCVPVHTEATPGERPLVQAELDLVSSYFRSLRIRYYTLCNRLDRFILVAGNYERSPVVRRFLFGAVALLDTALLAIPGVQRLAGTCVLYGRPNKSALSSRVPDSRRSRESLGEHGAER